MYAAIKICQQPHALPETSFSHPDAKTKHQMAASVRPGLRFGRRVRAAAAIMT
jgi:hypothetical protein